MFACMMRSDTIRLDPAKAGEAELRLVGDRVSCLWNAANFQCRKAFIAREGVPLGSALERLMKDTPEYRRLPSAQSPAAAAPGSAPARRSSLLCIAR